MDTGIEEIVDYIIINVNDNKNQSSKDDILTILAPSDDCSCFGRRKIKFNIHLSGDKYLETSDFPRVKYYEIKKNKIIK